MKRLLCVIVGHCWYWSGPRKTMCERCGMAAYWLPWSGPQ